MERQPVDLSTLTLESFAEHLETSFQVPFDTGQTLELELTDATALPPPTNLGPNSQSRPAPFTLMFSGPSEVTLSQHIYSLEHTALGRLDLFLVPLGPNQTGKMEYQAIFT